MSRMTCCSSASGSGWVPAYRSPLLLFFVSLFFLLWTPSTFLTNAAYSNCLRSSYTMNYIGIDPGQIPLSSESYNLFLNTQWTGQMFSIGFQAAMNPVAVPSIVNLSTVVEQYQWGPPTLNLLFGLVGSEVNVGSSNRIPLANATIEVGGYFPGDEPRFFSQTSFFTRAEEVLELATLTRFAISNMRVQNVGIQNAATLSSPKQAKFSEYYLNRMGMAYGASWWWVLVTDDYFSTPVISYLRSIVFSAYSDLFLKNIFQQGIGPLFVTSYTSTRVTDYILDNEYSGDLYYSSTNPNYWETNCTFCQPLLKVYTNPYTGPPYPNSYYYNSDFGLLEAAAAIGSATATQLGLMVPETTLCNNALFMSLLLGANAAISVDLDDIHIGGYTGKCSSTVDPACSCNQGGRTVWMYHLNTAGKMLNVNYTFTTSDSKCYFENEDIPVPLLVSFFSFSSGDLTSYSVTMDYAQQLLNSFGVIPRTASNAATYFTLLNITLNQDNQEGSYATAVYSNYPGSVMVGVITTTLANYIGNQLLGIGMLTPVGANATTTYNEYSISVFPLPSSTVWFAFSVPIQGRTNAGDSSHNYCVPTNIIETNISGLSSSILSARTYWNCPSGFLPPGDTDTSLQYGINWSSEISTLIPGNASVTSLYVDFLQTNPKASLYLYFSDFALSYNSILSDFQTASVDAQQRMYTITNLPQWNDNTSEATIASPLLKAFQTVSNSSEWTPQHLIMFTSLLLLREAAQHAINFSAAVLSKTIFDEQSFDLLGLPLVYSSKSCSPSSIALGSTVCMGKKNDGAANAHFISMRQVIATDSSVVYPEAFVSTLNTETTVAPVESHYPAYNPSGTTVAPTQIPVFSGSNAAFLALVIVFVVLSALLGLGFFGWHLLLAYRKREFRSPQGNRPVTCVVFAFGDALSRIEVSKGFKAAEVVRKNLEHTVRKAVKAHGLYEVVNTGGCIQAVTEDAHEAVQCCIAAQTESAKIDMRISMGVSTSLVAVKPPADGRSWTYRGWSMTEALRIATEISNGLIVVSDKTWYAMKKSEAIRLHVPRVHRRRLLDTLTASSARHELFLDEFYIIVPPVLADEYHDTSSDFDVPDPSEFLIRYFNRMGDAERASSLQSLSQSWSLLTTSRDQVVNDEVYCNSVLQHLLQALLSEQSQES